MNVSAEVDRNHESSNGRETYPRRSRRGEQEQRRKSEERFSHSSGSALAARESEYHAAPARFQSIGMIVRSPFARRCLKPRTERCLFST